MQLEPKSADNSENRCKLRVARRREGLVETLTAQAGLASELRHAFGTGNVSKRGREEGGVAIFERSFKACVETLNKSRTVLLHQQFGSPSAASTIQTCRSIA